MLFSTFHKLFTFYAIYAIYKCLCACWVCWFLHNCKQIQRMRFQLCTLQAPFNESYEFNDATFCSNRQCLQSSRLYFLSQLQHKFYLILNINNHMKLYEVVEIRYLTQKTKINNSYNLCAFYGKSCIFSFSLLFSPKKNLQCYNSRHFLLKNISNITNPQLNILFLVNNSKRSQCCTWYFLFFGCY